MTREKPAKTASQELTDAELDGASAGAGRVDQASPVLANSANNDGNAAAAPKADSKLVSAWKRVSRFAVP